MVSTPLPVRSRYATRCGPRTREPGEALRRQVHVAVGPLGAVATKNTAARDDPLGELGGDLVESVAAMTRFSQVAGHYRPIVAVVDGDLVTGRVGAPAGVVARAHERARLDVREARGARA